MSDSKVDDPPPYAPPQYGFAPQAGQQQQQPAYYIPQQPYPQPQQPYPPQYGMPPPSYGSHQQHQPPMAGGYPPQQSSSTTVIIPGANVATSGTRTVIINTGNCPVCAVGVLRDELTCFGITMAILLFPIGLLCLLLTQKRCSNCGSTF